MKTRALTSLVFATLTPWVCLAETAGAPLSGIAEDDVPLTPPPSTSPGSPPPEIGPYIQRLQSLYASGDRSAVIASIIRDHAPLARATDPWGLRATGEIAPIKTAVAVEEAPRPPDKFDEAVAALKVPIVAHAEGWALVNGVELYVGDTLVLSYQGTEVRATLSSLSPTQLVFKAPDGRSNVKTIARAELADLGSREKAEDHTGDNFKSIKGVTREVGRPSKK